MPCKSAYNFFRLATETNYQPVIFIKFSIKNLNNTISRIYFLMPQGFVEWLIPQPSDAKSPVSLITENYSI